MHPLPPVGHADLHVHPSGNAVGAKTPMAVYAALRASDLQVAVLTDHNRVDVARELVARSRDEGIPIGLVVGEEITTREGHLLGVGLTALVAAGLSLADAAALPARPADALRRVRERLPRRRQRWEASHPPQPAPGVRPLGDLR